MSRAERRRAARANRKPAGIDPALEQQQLAHIEELLADMASSEPDTMGSFSMDLPNGEFAYWERNDNGDFIRVPNAERETTLDTFERVED